MHRYSESSGSRAARIDDPDIMDRIRLVEGPQWCRGQSEPKDSTTGKSALEKWRSWCVHWEEQRAEEPERVERMLGRDGATMIIIYGEGGNNRYFVRGDGTVVFSLRHAVKSDDVRKAEEAGFPIFR